MPTKNERTPIAVDEISKALQERRLPLARLAEATGIPEGDLEAQLTNPDTITLDTYVSVTTELDLPLPAVFRSEAA